MPLRFAPLLKHLDKSRHFRAQDIGRKRLEDVIDAADGITLADVDIALADGCQKNNRSMFGFVALADQRCRLESVNVGHCNIEQNNGNFIPEKILQRLRARSRFHEVLAEPLQDSFESEQILAPVVNEKNVDLFGGRHYP